MVLAKGSRSLSSTLAPKIGIEWRAVVLEPAEAGSQWRRLQCMGVVWSAGRLQQWVWDSVPIPAVHPQVPAQPSGSTAHYQPNLKIWGI